VLGIQKIIPASNALEVGKRIHELLEEHYRQSAGMWCTPRGPHNDKYVEQECQLMMARYKAQYPQEPFSVVDIEQKFELAIPGTNHVLSGRMDGVVRMHDTKKLWLLEHKSEGSPTRNKPEVWASKGQVGVYLWAGAQLYGEEFGGILLNVITRSATSTATGARFRRDSLIRTLQQQQEAIDNVVWAADQIEALEKSHGAGKLWPQDRNRCYDGWRQCPYYSLHVTGRTEETLRDYEAIKRDDKKAAD